MIAYLPYFPDAPLAELECAACGEDAAAAELLELLGEVSGVSRRLMLCPDCRDEETEIGGEG